MVGADLLVHTAAAVTLRTTGAQAVWEANALATTRVLRAARQVAVQRAIHLSSITVFGLCFPDGVTEDVPVQPTGLPYTDTKIAAELAALQIHAEGGLEVVVLRPGDIYGPASRSWLLEPLALIRAGRFVLPRGGRGIFSPVHIDNLLDAVLLAATSDRAPGQIFTITDGAGVENRRFFAAHAEMAGRRLRTAPAPVARTAARIVQALAATSGRETDASPAAVDYLDRRGTYSNAKARDTLDWQPLVDLDTGLDGMRRWADQHAASHLGQAAPRAREVTT